MRKFLLGDHMDDCCMNTIAVCETPLHLLNVIALLQSFEAERKSSTVDLIVINQFELKGDVRERIESSGLFNSVNVVTPYYSRQSKIGTLLNSMKKGLMTKSYFQAVEKYYRGVPHKTYDCLLAGCATAYAMDVKIQFCPQGKTAFFEEGEGSYLGNFVKSAACFDREILRCSKSPTRSFATTLVDLLSRHKLRFNPDSLYLYRPELVDGGIYRPVIELRQISPLSAEPAAVVRRIFGDLADTVEAKWVFLGNPDCDVTESEFKRIQAIVTCVASHCADLLYRPHPRSRRLPESVAAAVSQDRSESMWEIRCLNGGVDDDTVLFGFGSTAQINPVRMFGLKPTLVFLHNFLNDGIDRTCAERCYSEAKALYGEGDKVFAPASMRELESLLRRLSNVEDIKNETLG